MQRALQPSALPQKQWCKAVVCNHQAYKFVNSATKCVGSSYSTYTAGIEVVALISSPTFSCRSSLTRRSGCITFCKCNVNVNVNNLHCATVAFLAADCEIACKRRAVFV